MPRAVGCITCTPEVTIGPVPHCPVGGCPLQHADWGEVRGLSRFEMETAPACQQLVTLGYPEPFPFRPGIG